MISPKARSAVLWTRCSPAVSTAIPRARTTASSTASEPAPATAIVRSRGIRAIAPASTACVGSQIIASASASEPGSPRTSSCPDSGSRHPASSGVQIRILATTQLRRAALEAGAI